VKIRLMQLARLPPERVDLALVALLLLGGLTELIGVAGDDAIAGVPVLLLLAAGVHLRHRHPAGSVALGVVGIVVLGMLPREISEGSAVPFLALIFLVFSMAMKVDPPRLYVVAALTLAGGYLSLLVDDFADDPADYLLVAALLVAAPLAGGRLLRSRSELTRALREKAERAERERARRAEEAVSAERVRIADELHDVVAHALGAMTVQAAAARRLTEKNPQRAGGAFQAVEDTGREALTELRRLLGVLRRADEDLALAPRPQLAFLEQLAQRAAAAGLRVGIEVEGIPTGDLPVGVDLTAYRVVQEALNEALSSGGAGSATVHVRHRNGEVEVEVVDDGHATERRLLGMRERVRVYGGKLDIAPRREGGHSVRARLPVERAA
jgi:signal transduction histidine kinase